MQNGSWKFHVPQLGVDLQVHFSGHTDEAFREARRKIGRDLREISKVTADETILPLTESRARYVRTISGAGAVIRKGKAGQVYLTTQKRGKLKDAVGWIEFGGKSDTPIGPTVIGKRTQGVAWSKRERRMSRTNKSHAGAIKLPDGGVRRLSTTPRKFAGKHGLASSVKLGEPAFEKKLNQRLLAYFQTEGFTVE